MEHNRINFVKIVEDPEWRTVNNIKVQPGGNQGTASPTLQNWFIRVGETERRGLCSIDRHSWKQVKAMMALGEGKAEEEN